MRVGMIELRPLRLLFLSALAVCSLNLVPASAQVPIPLQEQIQVFNSLSAADQQALIRELQSQLPPAQRDAIVSMLMGQQGQAPANPSQSGDVDMSVLTSGLLAEFEAIDTGALGAGDTLVIEFSPSDANGGAIAAGDLYEFLERLEDGNPYELDVAGRLYLPGVPAIALAGLDVDHRAP